MRKIDDLLDEYERMIVEHRIYTVAHGRMADYLFRFEQKALPIQLRHLGKFLGSYVSEIGPLNQVTHIWAYQDLLDREERRAKMAADPEWERFFVENAGTFVEQENRILRPASFACPYLPFLTETDRLGWPIWS